MNKKKDILRLIGYISGGYFLYKLLKGNKVTKAVEETIQAPVKAVEEVIDIVEETVTPNKKTSKKKKASSKKKGRFVKGSPEAKKFMAELQAKRKAKSEKRKIDTKKGLEQWETISKEDRKKLNLTKKVFIKEFLEELGHIRKKRKVKK